jgi:hypothetical protein
MSYRLAPLAPAAAKIQRVQDDEGRGVGGEFGLDRGQFTAGAGRGQSGHAEAQSELVGQLVGVDALAGGHGLDAPHGGPLAPFAEEDQDWAGGGAGEVVEPGLSGGDGDGEVEGGPGLAGLLLGGQDPIGIGRPQALDEPAGFAGGGDPSHDLPEGADGQLGRWWGWVAGPASARVEVNDLAAGGLERAGAQGDAVGVLVVACHAAPSKPDARALLGGVDAGADRPWKQRSGRPSTHLTA